MEEISSLHIYISFDRRCRGFRQSSIWSCILFYLIVCMPLARNHLVPCTDGNRDSLEAETRQYENGHYGQQDSHPGNRISIHFPENLSRDNSLLKNFCRRLESFCFLSLLPGFVSSSSYCRTSALETLDSSNDSTIHESFNLQNKGGCESILPTKGSSSTGSGTISCSLNIEKWIPEQLTDEQKSIKNMVSSCSESSHYIIVVPKPGNPVSTVDGYDSFNSDVIHGSSSLHVMISPPFLDWGARYIYTPSLAYLTVGNTGNNSFLLVHEPFSTDPQFYPYDFQGCSLAPGDTVKIAFIFFPRMLGSISARLFLRTSHGVFMIRAEGLAIESMYQIFPQESTTVSCDKKSTLKFSLHNPFENFIYVQKVSAWISVFSESVVHFTHISCMNDRIGTYEKDELSLIVNPWLYVRSDPLGLPFLGVKPNQRKEVPPGSTEDIMELRTISQPTAKMSGSFCIEIHNSSQNATTIVMIPFKIQMQNEVEDYTFCDLLPVLVETLVSCDGKHSDTIIISLRNSIPKLLKVVKISVDSVYEKFFKIKYMQGLLLFPETVTRVAVVHFLDLDLHPSLLENSKLGCRLDIWTNDSSNPHVKIPCLSLLSASYVGNASDFTLSESSYVGLGFQREMNEGGDTIHTPADVVQVLSTLKVNLTDMEADELIVDNWSSQGKRSDMSVLEDHEIVFPVTQIGSYSSKQILVKNPSRNPVVMQLVINSGAIIDHCISDNRFSYQPSVGLANNVSGAIVDGFSLADHALTEAYVPPHGTALFGPILFHSSDQCQWRSSAIIRNNLSGVEWLPLQGTGGSPSLILIEGSGPVLTLEFSLDIADPPNVYLLEHLFPRRDTTACNHILLKEVYAKNVGDLPLEIKTIKISGTDCALDGFVVHDCRNFFLEPREALKLLISYQSDSSSTLVYSELQLGFTNGILSVPMKAILPVPMINLCSRSSFWMISSTLSLILLVASCVLFLIFWRILRQVMYINSEKYLLFTHSSSISTISSGKSHQRPNKKQTRSSEYSKIVQDNSFHESSSSSTPITRNLVRTVASSGPLETHVNNLTVKVERERGRRRKKKAASGLTGKVEISSQSGTSTPSSPMSPLTPLTPKRLWPVSSSPVHIVEDTSKPILTKALDMNHEKKSISKATVESDHSINAPVKCHSNRTAFLSPTKKIPTPQNPIQKPVLLPSATFPQSGWRSSEIDPRFNSSNSPIAPPFRAPGSKLHQEESVKENIKDGVLEEFTYDIWGNHFSQGHLGTTSLSRKSSDAMKDDNSQSFFAKGPQSLLNPKEISANQYPIFSGYGVNFHPQSGN